MITQIATQLQGEHAPQEHYALVFPRVMKPVDFLIYRKAISKVVKTVLAIQDDVDCNDELYWLLTINDAINDSFDVTLKENK